MKIEIKPHRDLQNFKSLFRKIIQKDTGYDEDINKIVQNASVKRHYCGCGKTVDEFKAIRRGDLVTGELELGGRMINVIKGLNEEQIDELTLLIPEDEIGVKYKPNGSSAFKVLTNASAAKTSAILTFLLSFGETPLFGSTRRRFRQSFNI